MSVASWTAALRIARREAWRGKLRSALVLALVGLPIFVLAGADVLYQTWQLSPRQQLSRTLGCADADVQWVGQSHIEQTPDPADGVETSGPTASVSGAGARPPSTAELASHLPQGSRMIGYLPGATTLTFFTRSGLDSASETGLDYADPIASGMVTQVSGRAPRSLGELALTTALAADSGLGIGDAMHTLDPKRTLRVVGLVLDGNRADRAVYALPAAVHPPLTPGSLGAPQHWLVDAPNSITWADVTRLNALGYVTVSRQVLLDPPPKSLQTLVLDANAVSAHAIATGTLIGGMVLLEIVLLAGPAFAVGARRRRRELGLLAAVGGGRADLRRVVLADAVVLGLTAGLVATVAGIAAAAAVEPLVARVVNPIPGPFDVPYQQLGALVLVSVITALLAAVLPAVRAARTDVVAALAGRRGTVRTRARIPIIGACIAATGAAVVLGTFGRSSASSVLLGVALIEIGLITASPGLIGLVARVARWLPLSGRIALRDASRNRAAASPAVAAVMATVIGAMAAAIGTASANAQQREQYLPVLPQRDAYVQLDGHPGDAGAVAAVLRRAIPGTRPAVISTAGRFCDDAPGTGPAGCLSSLLHYPTGSFTERWLPSDLPQVVVDDGRGVDALFGRHVPEASAALRAGRVVVLDSTAVHDGQVQLLPVRVQGTGVGERIQPTAPGITAPATVVDRGFAGVEVIVAPALARALGLTAMPVGVLAATSHTVTAAQRQTIAEGLRRIGDRLSLTTENGWSNSAGWLPLLMVGGAGVVAVFAALIATALANVDSRADLTLLAAVGAAPRTRRVLSFARATAIAGIGTVIGVAAGVLPARAWVQSVGAPVVIPWTAVLIAVVGIPALAGGLAWLFTRARLPSERPA